jgi:hypothetical protein
MNESLRMADIPAIQAALDRQEQERWRDMLIASRPDLKIYRTTKKVEVRDTCEN